MASKCAGQFRGWDMPVSSEQPQQVQSGRFERGDMLGLSVALAKRGGQICVTGRSGREAGRDGTAFYGKCGGLPTKAFGIGHLKRDYGHLHQRPPSPSTPPAIQTSTSDLIFTILVYNCKPIQNTRCPQSSLLITQSSIASSSRSLSARSV